MDVAAIFLELARNLFYRKSLLRRCGKALIDLRWGDDMPVETREF